MSTNPAFPGDLSPVARLIGHELQHMRKHWVWFFGLGILLTVCGTAAIVFPSVTVGTSLAVTVLVSVLLMLAGAATIVGAFYAGRWSGLIVQLLVGILYIVCGLMITEQPAAGAVALTMFLAASFLVLGIFRTVAALVVRYPQWGWSLLNGIVTLLLGIVIVRNLPQDAFWVIGLLVGIEMLFNGWTWIMLSLALRSLPAESDK